MFLERVVVELVYILTTSPTADVWKSELIATVRFIFFWSTNIYTYMYTNTDRFTLLALHVQGNNWQEL